MQIWILPANKGDAPSYEEKNFTDAEKRGQLRLVASPDGRNGSVTIHQDVKLYAGLFDGPESAEMPITMGRKLYVHLARGKAQVNGLALTAGDALMLTHETQLNIKNASAAEILIFDLF